VNTTNFGFSQQLEFSMTIYDMLVPTSFASVESPGPTFIFLLDVSHKALASGFILQCITSIRTSLDTLPEAVRVGIVTFSDTVTVYDLGKAAVYVVTDLTDPVLPIVWAAPISQCRSHLAGILDGLIVRAADFVADGHCFGSALVVSKLAYSKTGGVVLACVHGFPTVGPLAISAGQKPFKELGFMLNRAGLSIHLFAFDICELATLTWPSNLTGGPVHHYTSLDPAALHGDLFESISGTYLWDCSIRLRLSTGLMVVAVSGSCTLRDSTLFIPILPVRCALGFEVKVEAEFKGSSALFQTAILWTDANLRRVIRVMTYALPTTEAPGCVRAAVDEGVLAAFLMKRITAFVSDPQPASDFVRHTLTAMSVGGARYQSLYHLLHSLFGSPLLRPQSESRIAELIAARSMSLVDCLLYLYPRMFALDAQQNYGPLPLVGESFQYGSIVLAHTVTRIYVWVSTNAAPDLLVKFFGGQTVPADVPQTGTPENQRLNELIAACWAFSRKYLPVEIIPGGDARENVFRDILVDLRTDGGTDLKAFIAQIATFQ
jgi:hypothetical protein